MTEPSSGKQYVTLHTVSNYEDAQTVCRGIGGMLPEPRSSSENDFLNNGIEGWFFLGLTDWKTERQWQWNSDNSTVGWTLWKSGDPDGGRRENCAAHIVAPGDASRNKKWGSMFCEQRVRIPVICEKSRKYTIYYE